MTERSPASRLAPGQVTPKLRKLCEELVLGLWGALRVTRYHTTDNVAVIQAVRHVRALLSELFELQFDVSLLHYADDFYVNEVRLRTSPALFDSFTGLAAHLRVRQISGIRFAWLPSLDALARIISLLKETQVGGTPMRVGDIRRELARVAVGGIELTPFTSDELLDLPPIDAISFVQQSFFRAVSLVEDLHERVRAQRPVEVRIATRMVQTFVDLAQSDDATVRMFLVALTSIKNWRGYLPNHAVNTAILAVAFGAELGLNRDMLRELGTAALLADLGNAALPAEWHEFTGPLSDDQRAIMEQHPLRGLAAITGRQRLNRVVVAAALGCAGHHRTTDGGGYPRGLVKPRGIYQPIVAICDRFDALTTSRPHRPHALSRTDAVVDLLGATSVELNPVIVRAFALWVRQLPAYRVVMTEAGEVGLRGLLPAT